jgi:hypothetical protein
VRERLARRYRKLRSGTFRLRVLLPVGGVAGLAVYLLVYARPQSRYLHDVALEIGGDLVGAIIIVAILTPLIARAREGRIRERGRLDYDLFTDQVAAATSVVKILDTYSNLFDRPQTPQALAAIEQALGRHTRVQILLLHPDSAAATVRAEETHRATIRQEILRNLRVLSEFYQRLDKQPARRFEVRLYTAAASVTHYRCDDRAWIAFLSLGRHTSQGSQLEVDVDTSVGHFVEAHFQELWQEATPMPAYLRLRLSLSDGSADGAREFSLPYVEIGEVTYLADPQVLAYLARVHGDGGTALATRADAPDEQYGVQVLDDVDEQLRAVLRERFLEKYGWPGQAYLWLAPVPDGRRSVRRTRRDARG